jgi:outer membrane protein assembly factor BamB
MNYKKLLTLISLSTLASSCSDKVVLEGERKELILQSKAIATDASAQAESVVLSAPTTVNNWEMQGYNTTHVVPHLKFSGSFKHTTTFDGGSGSGHGKTLLYTPVIQNDRLYVVDTNGRLKCYDTLTQSLVWEKEYVSEKQLQRTLSVTGITVSGDMGYLSLSTDQAMAVRLDNGDVVWQQQLSDIARIPPVVQDTTVFYTNIDNMLEARDTKTGQQKWVYQSIQEEAMLLGGANVTTTATQVIAPFASGEVAALSPSGTMVWNDQISSAIPGNIINNIQHVYAPVVMDKHLMFASSHAGSLIAYNASTGRRVWEQPILTLQAPALTDSHMFVVDNQQRLMCLKKASGQAKWMQQLKIAEDSFSVSEAPIYWYGPLLLSNQLTVFGSNGTVLMMDPNTGDVKQTITLDHQVAMAPIVVKDRCYVVTPKNDIKVYE